MCKSIALLVSAWALAGVGCQDSFSNFFREERNLQNELADYMTRVVDDDSAKYVNEGPVKKLKAKWDDHTTRVTNFVKGQDLGDIEVIFRQVERNGWYKWGWGDKARDFKKHEDGRVTMEGPPVTEPVAKDALDTLLDFDLKRAMDAAKARMKEQSKRISEIQPQSDTLRKAANAPREVFGKI